MIQRVTLATVAVAEALLADPQASHWGYDLTRQTGLKSGALHPILARLREEGWVEDGWEDPSDRGGEGRPLRRYHRITPAGLDGLPDLIRRRYPERC